MDYKGIEALYAIFALQSFEAAAQKLCISQSAVSQRLKALEIHYGRPVLTRALPYTLTQLGQQLVGHFKQVCLLEERVESQIAKVASTPRISIAVNCDSLETWFLDIVEETSVFQDVLLEIIVDDQERTLEYLKNGLVSACLSTYAKEILGGRVQFLGNMEYLLVASSAFVEKFFSKGSFVECLKNAPALKFDANDLLHERYLEKFFNLDGRDLNYQVVPSARGFKKFALLGYGYALIPKIDILEELKGGKLVQLQSDKVWKIPLYWHHFAIESPLYQKFNRDMIRLATDKLRAF